MKENIIAGLDIGSSEVKLVIGQRSEEGTGGKLQIIGAVSVPTEGISRGIVNSIEDVTSTISACLEKAERLVGVPVTSVWVGLSGPYIKCEKSRGVVAVSKNNGEILEEDVDRVIEAARALSVPPNYEILHVIPIKFTVDNQEDIKYPVGMTGVRLEVETLIVQGLSTQIKNLTKAIYRTGLDINDLIVSPLAASEVVMSNKQKELGATLINIGSATTSIAVYEEGELLHTAILPIGSGHITSDIALGLRCPIDLAEKIKKEFGCVNPEKFKNEEVDISHLQDDQTGEPNMISRKYLADIIEARVEEIFNKIDQEFKKIERSGMLPAGALLIGGGSKLQDIIEVAKEKLRLPASLGSNKGVAVLMDKVNDLDFLTALGLVFWGDNLRLKRGFKINWPGGGSVDKTISAMSGWLKKLLP